MARDGIFSPLRQENKATPALAGDLMKKTRHLICLLFPTLSFFASGCGAPIAEESGGRGASARHTEPIFAGRERDEQDRALKKMQGERARIIAELVSFLERHKTLHDTKVLMRGPTRNERIADRLKQRDERITDRLKRVDDPSVEVFGQIVQEVQAEMLREYDAKTGEVTNAIRLLGEYRATEAAGILLDFIRWSDPNDPSLPFNMTQKPYQWHALVNLGLPVVEEIARRADGELEPWQQASYAALVADILKEDMAAWFEGRLRRPHAPERERQHLRAMRGPRIQRGRLPKPSPEAGTSEDAKKEAKVVE